MSSHFSVYDFLVLGAYFAFMLMIGWAFRRASSTTSDYFRGGGSMLWWMVGSSAFMTQFSAWTFTGAAAKAYQDGAIILVIYFANAAGFFLCYLFTAAWFRQIRVITAVEAVRRRMGRVNEQVFTWVQLPISLIYAGIWLNALGVFFAAVFNFDLNTTIFLTGFVVLFISLVGGAWAVSASDFVQVLVLMLITVVASAFALFRLGGPGELVAQFPSESIWGNGVETPTIVYLWIVAILIKQIANTNNLMDASRYLNARDSVQARKAALLAAVLFTVGPIIWFIPPMAAAVLVPDVAARFPGIPKPEEAAYVAICLEVLPVGMMGLLASGMFAATMSSMDSGLNRNAGIFVRNFYLPVCRPQAHEAELMTAGKVVTVAFGGLIIMVAMLLNQIEGMSLFNIMLQFGTLVALPLTVPLILTMLVRRSPDWAAWASILGGMAYSLLLKLGLSRELAAAWLGVTSVREFHDVVLILGVTGCLGVGSACFFLACWLDRRIRPERQAELRAFFKDMETPVGEGDRDLGKDDPSIQIRLISRVAAGYGSFLFLMVLIPNPLGGRLAFVFCGACLLGISYLLHRSGKKYGPTAAPPKRPSAAGISRPD